MRTVRPISGVKITPIVMISVTFETPSAATTVTARMISGIASSASITRLMVLSTVPEK